MVPEIFLHALRQRCGTFILAVCVALVGLVSVPHKASADFVFPSEVNVPYLENITDIGSVLGATGNTGLPTGASSSYDELIGAIQLNSVLKNGAGNNLIPNGTLLSGMYGDLKVTAHYRPDGSGGFTSISDITPGSAPLDFRAGDFLFYGAAGRNPLTNSGDAGTGGYLIVSDNKTGASPDFTGNGKNENPQNLTLNSGGFSVSSAGVTSNNDNLAYAGGGTAIDPNHVVLAAKFEDLSTISNLQAPSAFTTIPTITSGTVLVEVGTNPVSSTIKTATRAVSFGLLDVVGGSSASSFKKDVTFDNNNTVADLPLGGPADITFTLHSQINLDGFTKYSEFASGSNDPAEYLGAPEPTSFVLCSIGLVCLGAASLRRRFRQRLAA